MNKLRLGFLFVLLGFYLTPHASEVLQDFGGSPKKLTDYTGNGKWLVVMIWAHDCHVCNQEVHNYSDFHEKHNKKDAQILGASIDGNGHQIEASAFIKEHRLSFPNLIGEPGHIAKLFEDLTGQVWLGTPSFLIFDPKGNLKAQQAGAVPVNLIEAFIEKETK